MDGLTVSWSIGLRPIAELLNTSLKAAALRLKEEEPPIVHSDRGGHYHWPKWLSIMEEHRLIRSMSARGCPPDNAACEGFFGRIKNKFFYGRDWRGVSLHEFMRQLDHSKPSCLKHVLLFIRTPLGHMLLKNSGSGLDFSQEHWRKIRSNNVIERLNREIKWKPRVTKSTSALLKGHQRGRRGPPARMLKAIEPKLALHWPYSLLIDSLASIVMV